MKISVVIPVYKNKEMFLGNLRHNLAFLQNQEIIVVDDHSQENIKEAVKKLDKKIKVLENTQNVGFSQTTNRGVNEASGDLILLLNSDVRLADDSYKTIISEFEKNNSLFAASFAQREKNGSIVGKNKLYFEKGMMFHEAISSLDKDFTAWAEAGSCIIRKTYFDNLGGFDRLYSPFYWEDIDLSYRAYKQGWKVLFVPEVIMEHHHESTIGKYYESTTIKKIGFRNQLLFIWKNIADRKMFLEHLIYLPYHLLYFILRGEFYFLGGFIDALSRLQSIVQYRKIQFEIKLKDDQEILSLFEK